MKQMLENGTAVEVGKNGITLTLPDGSIERIDACGRNVTNNELFKIAQEGDYVEYIPNVNTHLVSSEQSGVVADQMFNPSEHRLWQVLRKLDGQVELVAATENLILFGNTGHSNAVKTMNAIAQAHVDHNYATVGRAIGCPYEFERKNFSGMGLGEIEAGFIASDPGYESDLLFLGKGKVTIPYQTWLASCCIYGIYWDVRSYEVRSLVAGTMSDQSILCRNPKKGNMEEFGFTKHVMVGVLMARDVKVCGGDGSESNPFKIRR